MELNLPLKKDICLTQAFRSHFLLKEDRKKLKVEKEGSDVYEQNEPQIEKADQGELQLQLSIGVLRWERKIMETEAIDNQANLVNYDNENENEIDDLGYQSEEYIEDAHEDDENNHSNGYAKRGITRISGKHRALFSCFLGDMVREHIGLHILSGRRWVQKQEINYGMKSRWKLLMLNSASKETEDKIKEETLQVISGTDAMTLVLVLMRRAEQLLFGCDQNDAAFGRKCKKGSNGCTTFLDVVGGFAPHSHRISCFGSKGQHHQSTIQMITCENKTAPKVQMKRNNCLRLCDAMQRPESVHLLYDTHPPHIQYNYAALLAGVHSQ
ncbi:hypothetical protein Tco_1255758 [Tanacetum coccineum]